MEGRGSCIALPPLLAEVALGELLRFLDGGLRGKERDECLVVEGYDGDVSWVMIGDGIGKAHLPLALLSGYGVFSEVNCCTPLSREAVLGVVAPDFPWISRLLVDIDEDAVL